MSLTRPLSSLLVLSLFVGSALAAKQPAEQAAEILARAQSVDMKCHYLSPSEREEMSKVVAKAELALANHISIEDTQATMARGHDEGATAPCSSAEQQSISKILHAALEASTRDMETAPAHNFQTTGQAVVVAPPPPPPPPVPAPAPAPSQTAAQSIAPPTPNNFAAKQVPSTMAPPLPTVDQTPTPVAPPAPPAPPAIAQAPTPVAPPPPVTPPAPLPSLGQAPTQVAPVVPPVAPRQPPMQVATIEPPAGAHNFGGPVDRTLARPTVAMTDLPTLSVPMRDNDPALTQYAVMTRDYYLARRCHSNSAIGLYQNILALHEELMQDHDARDVAAVLNRSETDARGRTCG